MAQKPVFKRFHQENGLISNYINGFLQDSKGFLWIASDKGLSRFDGKNFLHFNVDNGLKGNMIHFVKEDKQGNIWFDIYEKGFYYWDTKEIKPSAIKLPYRSKTLISLGTQTLAQFFGDDVPNSAADTLTDYEGNQWISVFGKGLYQYIPYLTHLPIEGGLTNFWKDTSTQATYLSGQNGVYIIKNKEIINKISLKNARAIYHSSQGKYLVGSLYYFYENISENELFTKKFQGKMCSGISDITQKNKQLWISSFGEGIWVRRQNKKNDTITLSKGLVSNNIEHLHATPHYMWASTYGNGLSRIDAQGNIKNFTQKEGLLSNTVYQVYEEHTKKYWISTQLGISIFEDDLLIANISSSEKILGVHYYHNNWYAVSDKHLYTIANQTLKRLSNIYLSIPATSYSINRVFFDKNKVLILSNLGMSVVDLDKIPPNGIQPKLSILYLKNGEYRYPKEAKNIQISYQHNTLEISFAILSFLNEEENYLTYRFKKKGAFWSKPIKSRELLLEHLPDGSHTIELKAFNAAGIASDSMEIRLQVMAPFWRTPWFLTLIFVLILLLFGFILWYILFQRLKSRLKKLELQQKIQDERERIARDLHDHVGSQLTYMIAHLEHTAVETNQITKIKLEEISEYARNSIKQLRETIWAIHRSQITLEDLESKIRDLAWNYSKTFAQPKISVHAQISPKVIINSVQGLNTYRIVQEALNNAFKYSKASQIWVQIESEQNLLRLNIRDNGIGFDSKVSQSNQYGILSMQKRAKEIGATFKIETDIGKSTQICIEMPL